MRTKGAAVATATDWITNFIVVEITPIGIQNIGWKFCEFRRRGYRSIYAVTYTYQGLSGQSPTQSSFLHSTSSTRKQVSHVKHPPLDSKLSIIQQTGVSKTSTITIDRTRPSL